MKWQNEKIISFDSPAREESTHYAVHSPIKTIKNAKNKQGKTIHHEHKWNISMKRWRCSICGKTYG